MTDDTNLVSEIEALGEKLSAARAEIEKRIIGQTGAVDLTLAAMLCGGHGCGDVLTVGRIERCPDFRHQFAELLAHNRQVRLDAVVDEARVAGDGLDRLHVELVLDLLAV